MKFNLWQTWNIETLGYVNGSTNPDCLKLGCNDINAITAVYSCFSCKKNISQARNFSLKNYSFRKITVKKNGSLTNVNLKIKVYSKQITVLTKLKIKNGACIRYKNLINYRF